MISSEHKIGKIAYLRKFSIILLFSLIFTGCTFVRIQNVTEIRARVVVVVPDSANSSTRLVKPGGIVDVFSTHGGRYRVSIIPDAEYVQFMENLRTEISNRLFNQGATLTANEVANLTGRLNEIDEMIKRETNISAACSGSVPDFETAVVIVSFDEARSSWVVSCN